MGMCRIFKHTFIPLIECSKHKVEVCCSLLCIYDRQAMPTANPDEIIRLFFSFDIIEIQSLVWAFVRNICLGSGKFGKEKVEVYLVTSWWLAPLLIRERTSLAR